MEESDVNEICGYLELRRLFSKYIATNFKPTTPQQNSSDCGVYAAAYATELALCGAKADLQALYTVSEMRPHLENCLSEATLKAFPRAEKRVGRRRVKVICMTLTESEANVIL